MTAFRLASGGRIDRSRTLRFQWNGRTLEGYPGDTLASALLANDVLLMARSLKYHRPRGLVCAGSEEPNGLVQLGVAERSEPNTRATQIELFDGLVACAQNCWPSVDTDFGAVTSLFSRLLVAGFYYKTFMWPAGFWTKLYEPIIRRAAGLGKAPPGPDPQRYDKMHAHADVLVAGGGPAGLAAALAAARTGARVIIADEQSEPGGSFLALPGEDRAEKRWVASIGGGAARASRSARAAAHHGLRLSRPQLPLAAGAAHRSSGRCRSGARAASTLERARQAGDSRHRRARAAARLPRQRSAGRDARLGHADLLEPLRGRRPERRSWCSPTMTALTRRRRT